MAAGGLLVLAGAFLLGQHASRDTPSLGPAVSSQSAMAPPVTPPAAPPATAGPPPVAAAVPPAPLAVPASPGPPAAPAEPARAAPVPVPPSFDHVRISPRGEMVLAGRAEPEAEVTILFGSQTLGVVRADLRGEWVFVPAQPVASAGAGGGTELSLRARARDGTVTDGNRPVLVLLPAPEPPPVQVATAAPSAAPPAPPAQAVAPTVVELPRDAALAPRVLQAPMLQAPVLQAPVLAPPPSTSSPSASSPPASSLPSALPEPPPVAALPVPPQLPGATAVLPSPPAALPPAPGAATPPSRGPVSLQVVDYDERGEVRFAGTATPNAPVRVYVNNDPVGEATTGADGRWTVSPAAPVAPGVHQLRVDQLMPSGQVAQRVEAPFQRVEVPPESLRDGQVVVQPGHNLWRIARSVYGRGVQHTVIYQANREQIRNPNLIYPGQVFHIPAAN